MTTDAGVRSFGMRVFFFWDGLLLFSLAYIVSWPHLRTDEPAGWILPVAAVATMFAAAFCHAHAAQKKAAGGVVVAAAGPAMAALLLIVNVLGKRLHGAYAIAVYVPTLILVVHLLATAVAFVIAYASGRRAAHRSPHLGTWLVFMTGATAFLVFSIYVF